MAPPPSKSSMPAADTERGWFAFQGLASLTFRGSMAPVLLFSYAIPGQKGTDHINEQWPDYWEALLSERVNEQQSGGFPHYAQWTDEQRQRLHEIAGPIMKKLNYE